MKSHKRVSPSHVGIEEKMKLSTIPAIIFGWFILSLGGHTMWKLMWFLSVVSPPQVSATNNNQSGNILVSLWMNAILILLFAGQHSYLKTKDIEKYLFRTQLLNPSIARSVYVLSTLLALQVVLLHFKRN